LAVWARLLPDALSGTFQRWPLWISAVGVLLAWGAGFWFFSGGVARKTSLPTSPDSRSTVKAVVSEPPLAGTGELSSEEPLTVIVETGQTLRQICLRYLGRFDSKSLNSVHALNPWLVDPDDIKVGQLVRLPRLSALSKRENVAAKQGAEFKATPKAKP